MAGPGPGGLPPIRRRGVARRADGRAVGAAPAAQRGVSGWEEVSGPPSGARDRRSGYASGWVGPQVGSARLERPNTLLVAGLAVLALLNVLLVMRGRQFELGAAIVIGMFVGVIVLGLVRLDANSKRSGGRFADWRIESVRVATMLFAIGWVAGLVSLWQFALVLSRDFTR